MIVDNFDIEGFAIPPHKAYPPLIVDADTVLALTVTRQRLQSVAWRLAQIVELLCCVDHQQLRPSPLLNRRRQTAHGVACEDCGGAFIAEALDHTEAYRTTLRNVNRDVPQGSTNII